MPATMKKWKFGTAFITTIWLLNACAGSPVTTDFTPVADEETILPRPRWEDPKQRPLGRIQIIWTAVPEALGYEIEMSFGEDFDQVERSWTVKGTDLEIEGSADRDRWFRIRAFTADLSSRWSAAQKITPGSG